MMIMTILEIAVFAGNEYLVTSLFQVRIRKYVFTKFYQFWPPHAMDAYSV